ncbi:MAG: ASCH domain-containing protein [Bacilli bacterium]|nr:ASCH domain-containing protein [Bacilli bacterium]
MNAEEMWKASKLRGEYEAWAFGGAPDKLADLVLRGIKTGTCSSYDLYQAEGEPIPHVGEYSVILNSCDEAVCIIQTTKIYIAPFSKATPEHAFKEGEGDRSLSYWQDVHREFFTEELQTIGKPFDESILLVYEEFEVVYR